MKKSIVATMAAALFLTAYVVNGAIITPSGGIASSVPGEVDGLADKPSPIGADILVIEDSAAGFVQKKTSISNLPFGDASGPASSTDEALTRFDGTTGKATQNSTLGLSDTDALYDTSGGDTRGEACWDAQFTRTASNDVCRSNQSAITGSASSEIKGNLTSWDSVGQDFNWDGAGNAIAGCYECNIYGGGSNAIIGSEYVSFGDPTDPSYTDFGSGEFNFVALGVYDASVQGTGNSNELALIGLNDFDSLTGIRYLQSLFGAIDVIDVNANIDATAVLAAADVDIDAAITGGAIMGVDTTSFNGSRPWVLGLDGEGRETLHVKSGTVVGVTVTNSSAGTITVDDGAVLVGTQLTNNDETTGSLTVGDGIRGGHDGAIVSSTLRVASSSAGVLDTGGVSMWGVDVLAGSGALNMDSGASTRNLLMSSTIAGGATGGTVFASGTNECTGIGLDWTGADWTAGDVGFLTGSNYSVAMAGAHKIGGDYNVAIGEGAIASGTNNIISIGKDAGVGASNNSVNIKGSEIVLDGPVTASSHTPTYVTGTSLVTTASLTDVVMTGMTTSPGDGDWEVSFTATMSNANNNQDVMFSIYANGVQIPYSEMTFGSDSANDSDVVNTMALVTGLGFGQAIDIRWNTSGGTAQVTNRVMRVARAF